MFHIQELKGNIRVFCRMRPFLKSEIKAGETSSDHIAFDDSDETKVDFNLNFVLQRGGWKCCNIVTNLLPFQAKLYHISIQWFLCQIVVNDSNSNTPAIPFKFDLVFKQDSTQSLIFDELSQLVQSALDGYR